jgi:hypothetical protein
MGYVDRLIGWAGRHPYLSVAGLIITFLGGGMALGQLYKSKDSNGTAAVSVIFADSPTHTLAPTPAPTFTPAANATVKATPALPQNYFDKDLGKGFYIEGPPSFVNNITSLMLTWKAVDPKVYNEYVGHYTPKKIVKSRDIFSAYEIGNDVIELPEVVEVYGGSNDIRLRKEGLPNLFAEWDNALKYKSGYIKSFKEQEKSRIDYAVKLNDLTQEQADAQFKAISGRIDNGTYLDNAKH